MKNKKLFAMMTVILAMGLAACGGKTSSKESEKPSSAEPTPSSQVTPSSEVTPSSSSEAPKPSSSSSAPQSSQSTPQPSSSAPQSSQSTPQPSSSSSAPQSSSSEAPQPTGEMAVNALDVIKEDDKVYLKISGTISGFANADAMKMAFGLLDAIPAQGATAEWLVGSENPADADYTLVPTVNDGAFVLKVDVTVVTTIKAGVYTIYVGPKGAYAAVSTNGVTMGTGKQILSGYRWYIRGDKGALAMDELPPIELTVSRIEVDEVNNKVYHLIGGALNEAKLTKEAFLAKHPYVQYEATTVGWKQNVLGSSTKTDLVTTVVDESNNALIKTDITSLPANGYNIKINLSEDKDADTKMDAVIDGRENPVPFGMYDYAVYADSSKTAKEDLYGNCGLFIMEANRYVNAGEKVADLQPVQSKEGEVAYEMVAADCEGQNAPKASDKNTRLGKNNKLTDVWDITGIRSGEYEVYVKAAYSAGNGTSYWSGAQNVEHASNPDNEKGNNKTGNDYNPAARYKVGIDALETVDFASEKTYADCGLVEAKDDGAWTNVSLAKVMVPEGSTSFTITSNNNGYAIWIYAVRIVRVGNWTKPVTPAAFTAGVMRVEAESYHEASADPTIKTEDGVTFVDHVGGWPQFNASYKISFAEAVHVKLKLRYAWYSQMFGRYGAAELTMDGGSKIHDASGVDNLAQADENMTGEWLETESVAFDITAGDHTFKFQTPGGCTVSWDYFELIVVEAA